MTYQSGTSTSPQDFLTKLFTFATANGWTQDEFDTVNKRATLHKGTVYVTFVWDTSGNIALFQSLGFTSGNAANNHPNDSGNTAQVTGTISRGRYINLLGTGPYTSHSFFSYSAPDAVYAVIEFSPGLYRHFGFGQLDKYGSWTGGEFVGATFWDQGGGSISNFVGGTHNVLFDGGNIVASPDFPCSSIHIEGLPNQGVSGKWGVVSGRTDLTSAGNDTAGNAREWVFGGVRSGPYSEAYAKYETSALQGFVPLIPVPAFYRNRGTTPNRLYHLGYFPYLRAVNLAAFEVQQEIALGADTWKVFPMCRKQQFVNNGTQQSGNAGLAFLKA